MAYPSKYKPEYCDQLIEHMKQGKALKSFGAEVNVTEATLHAWKKKYPEFDEAHQLGTSHHYKFFEQMGLNALVHGKQMKVEVGLWYIFMKNIHNWSDRQQQDISIKSATGVEEYLKDKKKEQK